MHTFSPDRDRLSMCSPRVYWDACLYTTLRLGMHPTPARPGQRWRLGVSLTFSLSFLIFLSILWADGKPWQTMHRQFCWKHCPKIASYSCPEAAPGVHVDHLILWEYCTCLYGHLLMPDMHVIIKPHSSPSMERQHGRGHWSQKLQIDSHSNNHGFSFDQKQARG